MSCLLLELNDDNVKDGNNLSIVGSTVISTLIALGNEALAFWFPGSIATGTRRHSKRLHSEVQAGGLCECRLYRDQIGSQHPPTDHR